RRYLLQRREREYSPGVSVEAASSAARAYSYRAPSLDAEEKTVSAGLASADGRDFRLCQYPADVRCAGVGDSGVEIASDSVSCRPSVLSASPRIGRRAAANDMQCGSGVA